MKNIEETQKVITDYIEGCNKTVEAGAFLYKTSESTAESVWKVISLFPLYYD